MIECTCKLVSIGPLSFSKAIQSTRGTGEAHDAFEERTWRERLHLDPDGNVFLPPQNLKNCLADVAKYLAESVPGKGKATFTKHVEAGVMVVEAMPMLDHKGKAIVGEDVKGERLFVPSDGKRGGGSRVYKWFPIIPEWQVSAQVLILDPMMMTKPEKIEEYLKHAGQFIGMGRFRPRNNGYYGRFRVEDFSHQTFEV